MWFRRDLRADDHPALEAACAAGPVLPLFVVDLAFARSGDRRQRTLVSAVARLDHALEGTLVIRVGEPTAVVPEVAAEIAASAVFVTKDYGPYGRRRDEQVATALQAAGRRLRGIGSPYAVEPGTLRTAAGGPFRGFTPVVRRWREAGWAAPRPSMSGDWIAAHSDRTQLQLDEATPLEWQARWSSFVRGALDQYPTARNRPDLDGTSRLSPH